MRRVDQVLKRLLDLSAAGTGMVALSPLLLAVGALVVRLHGWPPLFTQRRPGLGERIFIIYKFRTMTNERDAEGHLLPDAQRLTRFGQFLRATSMDELPELFNVFKGDMSLVGPRPLLVQYLGRYNQDQRRRHQVKPGVTGWAQINGRNALSWEEKFALDLWYVDHATFLLDLRILAMTALQVLRRQGISAPGEATMPEFMGSSSAETGRS